MTIIISTILVLISLVILYFILKKVPFSIKKDDYFDIFVKNIILYMKRYHPKITLNYKIVESTKYEKNTKVRQSLVIQDILTQFYDFNYIKTTQKTLNTQNLWPSYIENPKTSSFPPDWQQRKEFAYNRDDKCCSRCGQNLFSIKEAHTSFVRDIKDGGSYNFENIIILCIDCVKVIYSTNPKNSVISSLELNEKLLNFIVD